MKAIWVALMFTCLLGLLISCQSDTKIEFNRYYSNGSAVYQSHCQNCHGADGSGLQGLIPPLTAQAYINSNQATLACLVKNGITGKIVINGKVYDGKMPPTGLAPLEIAQVLTYVSNSFGNKTTTFTTDKVNAQLLNCR